MSAPPAPSGLDAAATTLRALHVRGHPLVLANVWDAASARAVASAGFPALATTSAGVAGALGYDDGERTPPAAMFAALASIARASGGLPVTADVEAGYGLVPGALVRSLLDAGASGCNLEDTDHATGTLVDPGQQAGRIAAIMAAAADAGVALVINARIDVYLRRGGGTALDDEAVQRGRLYLDAGAACVYPITLQDDRRVGAFVEAVGGNVNILLTPQSPPVARLAELGVARVSTGSGLYERAYTELVGYARELIAGEWRR